MDKDVDVPMLATSWGCRAHHGCGELMWLLFRAVYTGTRPVLTPAIRAGKGWRGRRELAGVLPPELVARVRVAGQTPSCNTLVRTTTTTTTTTTTRLGQVCVALLCGDL